MAIETRITCPLGHTCEKVVDGVVERCAWYVELEGENPQNGQRINQSKCAIAWGPLLNVENTSVGNRVAHSIQSLRNETIKRQDKALGMIHAKEIGNT